MRYLAIEGQSSNLRGGAFDYYGGDGALLVFEHVKIHGCASLYGGAVSIGNDLRAYSMLRPDYGNLEVDGGLRVMISGCQFSSNIAYKYGSVTVSDIWPLTFDMQDTTFLNNHAAIISAHDYAVTWFRPTKINISNHAWTNSQLQIHKGSHILGQSAIVVSNVYQGQSYDIGALNPSSTVFLTMPHIFGSAAADITLDVNNVTVENTSSTIAQQAGYLFFLYEGNWSVRFADFLIYGKQKMTKAMAVAQSYNSAGQVGSGLTLYVHTEVRFTQHRSRFINLGYKGILPGDASLYSGQCGVLDIEMGCGLGMNLLDPRSSAVVENSEFASIYAPGATARGPAVALTGPATVTLRKSLFTDNLGGKSGGAVWGVDSARVFIFESIFVANSVVPLSSALIPVLVKVFTGGVGVPTSGGTTNGRVVWRIDNGPIFGNMSYLTQSYYSQYVHLTYGQHTLYHGLIIDVGYYYTTWGTGTIDVDGITPGPLTVIFVDDRAEKFNCTAVAGAFDICPTNQILWGSTSIFVAGDAGGAVSISSAELYIRDSTFVNNSATVHGTSLKAVSSTISIINTSFSDTTGLDAVALNRVPEYDCKVTTCGSGQQCSFNEFSVSCIDCAVNEIGDGHICVTCEAGMTPHRNKFRCVPCPPGTVGKYGLCTPCSKGLVNPRPGGVDCIACPPGQVSNLNASGCICSFGSYNQSQLGIVTCNDNNYQRDAFDAQPVYAIARDQLQKNLQCIECPLCLDCSTFPVRLRPGFQQSPHSITHGTANKSFMRCRPETAHMDGLGVDGTGYDAMTPVCQAGGILIGDEPILAKCLLGHSGALCQRCENGYGRSNEDQCTLCKNTVDLNSTIKLVVLILCTCFVGSAVLIAVSFSIGDVYEVEKEAPNSIQYTNPLDSHGGLVTEGSAKVRTVSLQAIMKSCKKLLLSAVTMAIQPFKLFISYIQIVGHVGTVLHFQFPPLWARLTMSLRPLVANIQGVVSLECAGLSDFYDVWLVEVLLIPLALLLFLAGLYCYRCRLQGAAIATGMFYTEAFFLLFLVYPFVRCVSLPLVSCSWCSCVL
eukprot:COSAG01_NODE_641_length_14573_cov_17.634637_7_plen_1058_part_00